MRIRKHINYSDTRGELAEFKDLKRGGSEDELWVDTDEPIDYRKTKKRKKKYPRGCPGNDNGPHVYATNKHAGWVTSPWNGRHYWREWNDTRCCGCDKRRW